MDRLESMAVFVRAVDLGSFAAAAEALGLSGPMVGKHVRSLEQRLGVRLLNRTTRRQSLTDFGRAYYDRCRLILAESEAADALAADHLAAPRGKLRVTMPVHFGRRCVLPVLLDLARRHPGLDLELLLGDGLVDLADGGVDLAIRTGRLADQAGIVTRRVARQRMIVCAAPAYVAMHGSPRSIDDIPQHQAIVYGRTARIHPWLFPRPGGTPAEIMPAGRFRLDDLDAIADASAAGMGLTWLPSWLVRDRLAQGSLVRLFPEEGEFPYDCHALWLPAPHMPLKLRVAIDALVAELPKFMA